MAQAIAYPVFFDGLPSFNALPRHPIQHHQLPLQPSIHANFPIGGVAPRTTKRRLEDDDRGDAMDRSPTPERPRKTIPKRSRMIDNRGDGSGPSSGRTDEKEDVDVGVLLARLPAESLIPILTNLIARHPHLKSEIISHIPRPPLQTALQALEQAARKLRDSFPYSAPSTSGFYGSTSFGFGASTSFGFGAAMRPSPATPSTSGETASGNREEYVLSRIRPHIGDLVSTAYSFLQYFTCRPGSGNNAQTSSERQLVSETFQYLQALTSIYISQPAVAQTSLAPLLLDRLKEEWMAWVDTIDLMVNQHAKMFGQEESLSWIHFLDHQAQTIPQLAAVRNKWVARVGWLVNRAPTVVMV